MFFHVFPHNSVNSLHMHLVDLAAIGPTFAHLAHKNLAIADVLSVLRSELAAAKSKKAAAAAKPVPEEADAGGW